MRLDRLHRAYPSLHPFGVVHWVPVLSNIKTATGCESNRQLQLWTVFAGTVVNNYQFNGIQGWAGQLSQIRCRAVIYRMPEEVVRNTFFSGGTIPQWSTSSFIHSESRLLAAHKGEGIKEGYRVEGYKRGMGGVHLPRDHAEVAHYPGVVLLESIGNNYPTWLDPRMSPDCWTFLAMGSLHFLIQKPLP